VSPLPGRPLLGLVSPAEHCLQLQARLLDVERCPRAGGSPEPAGLPRLATRVHSPVERVPFRVPRCLPAVRPLAGPTPLSFLVPSTASLGWPRLRRVVQPHLGSAPRFSQPLSGFLARPSFVVLLHTPAVPGIPPFRAFPSQESRTPLGATCSPAVIRWRVGRVPGALSSPVSPASAPLGAVTCSPGGYGLPFRLPEDSPPGPPGPRAAKPPRFANFIDFEAFILLRVRSRRRGSPRADGRYSPGLLPL
jgi:hypothetical protein